MIKLLLTLSTLFFIAASTVCALATTVDAALQHLKDSDPGLRLDALKELEFSLDPRIPDAVLPLLSDEGDSIRAHAARAVGSRWWQIPNEHAGKFISALQLNADAKEPDKESALRESSMGLRGIGLLNRDYNNSSFSRSPDKRWVIYERFSCPCLLDTQNFTEELLGWKPNNDGKGEGHGCSFTPIWNRSTVREEVFWHPSSKMVACSTGWARYDGDILIWGHRKGIVRLGMTADAGKVLRAAGLQVGPFWLRAVGWRGDVLEFDVMAWEDPRLESCRLGWDSRTGKIRIISVVRAAK